MLRVECRFSGKSRESVVLTAPTEVCGTRTSGFRHDYDF